MDIPSTGDNPVIDIALHTISLGKQAIVFVGTKSSAEKQAEDIAKKIKKSGPRCLEISEQAKNALPQPTKQCTRLAYCIGKGIAFHHAGLVQKQRELIEKEFRSGAVKIICCTPTLALGVSLPAYRAVIRDLRRFGRRGMEWIPVLEYLQQAGRAGRPEHDDKGECIAIASTEPEQEEIIKRYIFGEPEPIHSKLAVEPTLRFYLLSLIASRFVKDMDQIMAFFSKTFYASQFKDIEEIQEKIVRLLRQLEEWEFITMGTGGDFQSADVLVSGNIRPTQIGKRVSELYLDPLTAHSLIEAVKRTNNKPANLFGYLHAVSSSVEMEPLLRVKVKEYDTIQEKVAEYESYLLMPEPSIYDPEYEIFMNAFKTALFLDSWMDESSDENLMEDYGIRPGEIRVKRDNAEWLLFSLQELCRLLEYRECMKDLMKLRGRLKHGIKEELVSLVRFRNIGRVRARILYNNNLRNVADIKKADLMRLSQLVGKNIALSLKEQVGEKVDVVPKGKRIGQLGLGKYNT